MAQVNTRNRKKKDGSNNWEYRFEAAAIDGKRKQISKSGFKTKKEALESGNKALAEYNRAGSKFEPTDMSVSDYLDYWFENYCKINLKHKTQESYAIIIRKHLKPKLGHYRLKSLTPTIMQEWVNSYYTGTGLTANTIIGITTTMSGALKYAVHPCKFIESSPMAYIKYPRTKKESDSSGSLRIVIEKEDFDKMCNRFVGKPFYYSMMIGYYTGLRIGEVYALTWDDIDLDNRIITVNKAVYKKNNNWCLGTTKTKTSNRKVKFGQTLYDALVTYKNTQITNEIQYGEYYTTYYLKNDSSTIVGCHKSIPCSLQPLNLVFRKENGEYSTTDSFKYAARVIHHELQMDFNFHSLRHTHATKLIEAGISPKVVQTRLGHDNIQTTLNTYTHTTDNMIDVAVDEFEKAMSTH